jgi:hypothetical protein
MDDSGVDELVGGSGGMREDRRRAGSDSPSALDSETSIESGASFDCSSSSPVEIFARLVESGQMEHIVMSIGSKHGY